MTPESDDFDIKDLDDPPGAQPGLVGADVSIAESRSVTQELNLPSVREVTAKWHEEIHREAQKHKNKPKKVR